MTFARILVGVSCFSLLVAAISSMGSACLGQLARRAGPGAEPSVTAPGDLQPRPTMPGCSSRRPWSSMMTAPGLASFYCGLVRKKNVLSVMMQCIFMMCLMTVVWALYGYSLVFGGNQPVGRRLQPPAHAGSRCRSGLPRGPPFADRGQRLRCTR